MSNTIQRATGLALAATLALVIGLGVNGAPAPAKIRVKSVRVVVPIEATLGPGLSANPALLGVR